MGLNIEDETRGSESEICWSNLQRIYPSVDEVAKSKLANVGGPVYQVRSRLLPKKFFAA